MRVRAPRAPRVNPPISLDALPLAELKAWIEQSVELAPGKASVGREQLKTYPITWNTPTFNAGWVDYGATDSNFPARYAKDASGLVMLRGFVSRPSTTWRVGDVMFTLPAGFRPGSHVAPLVVGFGSSAANWTYIQARANGDVMFIATATTWGVGFNLVGLSGISFWAQG